jgi:hypothetical protein
LPAAQGIPAGGEVLLVWGSGAYRADDLRLAVIDLRDPVTAKSLLGNSPFSASTLRVFYFAGTNGFLPRWSASEVDALPLLWPGALGELSVRWVPELERYLLMMMAGPEDPIGPSVCLRVAPTPWGPWSRRRQMFDWIQDGMGLRMGSRQFIHNASASPPDKVGDWLFDAQGKSGGDAYAPYLHDVTMIQDSVLLRYAMSTWNPYQAMLMEHVVSQAELRALE